MTHRVLLVLFFVLFCLPESGYSWGERGHKLINRVAAQSMPADMPKFMRDSVDALGFLGVQPDRWKSFAGALYRIERANHYLDMERLNKDITKIDFPSDRIKYLGFLRDADKKVDEIGLLPYQLLEYYERLRGAFMEYRWALDDPDGKEYRAPRTFGSLDSIESVCVHYAGILGHYAGDSSQPLHSTELYDGRDEKGEPKKTGVHIRYEVFYVNEHIKGEEDFISLVQKPATFESVLHATKDVLVTSNRSVDRLLTFDENKRLVKADDEVIEFTRQHMARGSQFLLDLWYTAWVRSGEDLEAYRARFAPKSK